MSPTRVCVVCPFREEKDEHLLRLERLQTCKPYAVGANGFGAGEFEGQLPGDSRQQQLETEPRPLLLYDSGIANIKHFLRHFERSSASPRHPEQPYRRRLQ